MTKSYSPQTCPECGAELPIDAAPDRPCPACLMKLGLESWAARGDEHRQEESPTTPWRSRFEPPAPEDLAAAFPNLEILELIGTGGMGAVYKARQPNLDRIVALKILPTELGSDPAFEERFAREAKALARFSHPNIITVYDFGQAERAHETLGASLSTPPDPPTKGLPDAAQNADDGSEASGKTSGSVGDRPQRLFYFLMEYVDGVNLRQLIRAGQFEPPQALALVPQICDAMQFAHDKGIVHRDIKPENILVDTTGRVKIADFGLAKIVGRPAADVSLTDTQQVVGTAHYMAPEQTRGSRTVDHRADIYSLGVVFYEMLTGELPVGRFEPPSRKVRVDVRLDNVVLRTLENEPDRRYQHASDVKTDVESIAVTAHLAAGRDASRLILPFERPQGLARYFILLAASIGLLWIVFRGLQLDVGPTVYLGAVRAFPILALLAWIVWAVPYADRPLSGANRAAKAIHLGAGGVLLVLGFLPSVADPGIYWLAGTRPLSHDRQAAFLYSAVIGGLTVAFLLANWYPLRRLFISIRGHFQSLARVSAASPDSTFWPQRHVQAQAMPGTMPMILASAIGMVLGGLSITGGIALAVYALLTQDVELGGFWGYMGGAFGCIVGGIGALAGSWNTYRQLEGAEDLMHSPRWTWLDRGLAGYTLLGFTSLVVAAAFVSTAAEVITYSLLVLGGIVVFQGVLFLAIRGLYRRAAQQNAGPN